MRILFLLLLPLVTLATALAPAGCSARPPGPQSGLPVVAVQVGQKTYQCEVATDDASRRQGLMHRQSMPEDHGMLFAFPYEQVLYFWMKNTLIPLDIVYLNRDGKVVAIRQMRPLNESSVGSKEPAQYAIELNAGQAEKAGVKEGDIIRLPQIPEPK
jgi:hypothetical protein